jgi:hypothetical protein
MGQRLSHVLHGTANGGHDEPEKPVLPFSEPHVSVHRKPTEELRKDVYIQPHTDEGGDAYYIGDAYEDAKCADEWEIDTCVSTIASPARITY